MNVRLTAFGLDALARGLRQMPETTRAELLNAMDDATFLLEREAADAMPSVSGLTRKSITSDAFSTPAGALGVVGSNAIAAVAVELGTRPHRPPVEPIEAWVTQKLGIAGPEARGIAFAIANKIAKVGTKAQRPFARTLSAQLGTLEVLFEAAARRVAERLAGDVNGGAA